MLIEATLVAAGDEVRVQKGGSGGLLAVVVRLAPDGRLEIETDNAVDVPSLGVLPHGELTCGARSLAIRVGDRDEEEAPA